MANGLNKSIEFHIMNSPLNPHFVTARYTQARIPQFAGNPLIEALPPSMGDDALISALTLMPDFNPKQQAWSTEERFMMLESLSNFMFPLRSHIELGRALDSMIRAGYVGRAPRTPEHAKIFQSIYEMQLAGQSFSQTASSRTPQISTSLIGLSGMGKTTTVNRWCAHLPKVIYHPELNLHQIPYLHVEMPSDGSSVKGLAQGILHQIDTLIPGADYYNQYVQRGRAGSDALMRGVARVMNIHLVGLLICDEVQNLANAKKSGQTVMTELVSAANDLKVPILFIGTNKAAKVLSMDFRQARRSIGHGIAPWENLHRGLANETSEWDDFLRVLWRFQWVKKPVPLDSAFCHYMYECSQGVIDLAIKLFASAQARAMLDGTEQLTPDLLLAVFDDEFKLVHPMVDAIKSGNHELLMEFDDIAPLNLQQHLDNARRKLKMMKSPLYSVNSTDPTFVPRLAAGLTAIGFDPKSSAEVAEAIADKDTPISLAQGVKEAVTGLNAPRPSRRNGRAKVVQFLPADRFDERPGDYRRAIAYAEANSTKTMAQLLKLAMAPSLESVLEI